MTKNVKFASDTVSVREPGSKYPTTIQKGMPWYADHPIVKANPSLFSDDPPEVFPRGWKTEPVAAEAAVEEATAVPGEKRAVTRPAPKKRTARRAN